MREYREISIPSEGGHNTYMFHQFVVDRPDSLRAIVESYQDGSIKLIDLNENTKFINNPITGESYND